MKIKTQNLATKSSLHNLDKESNNHGPTFDGLHHNVCGCLFCEDGFDLGD
jgi:hypothetical protein